jgi:general secretion pathway protein C
MRVMRTLVTAAVPVGIALVAYFNASAVSALVSGTISTGMPMPTVGEAKASTNTNANQDTNVNVNANAKSARAILDRNPFDHVTGPLHPVAQPGGEPERQLDLDPRTAPFCEGVRPLVVVGNEDQEVAFASLDVGGKHILRKRGGEVGAQRVAYVGRDRVWLEGTTGLCQALLFGVAPPPAVVTTADPTVKQTPFEMEVGKKIVKTGPNEYAVDRSAVDRILEAQQEIMKSRLMPDKEGDRIIGMKIFGIKQGSVLGMLGIENGDRLETINGFEVGSPEKMLEAYARIRSGAADKLTVHLTRGGKPINVDYTIR